MGPVSRPPCRPGITPVSALANDGKVHGAAAITSLATVPPRARSSRRGLVARKWPASERWSQRSVSTPITRRFGGPDRLGARCDGRKGRSRRRCHRAAAAARRRLRSRGANGSVANVSGLLHGTGQDRPRAYKFGPMKLVDYTTEGAFLPRLKCRDRAELMHQLVRALVDDPRPVESRCARRGDPAPRGREFDRGRRGARPAPRAVRGRRRRPRGDRHAGHAAGAGSRRRRRGVRWTSSSSSSVRATIPGRCCGSWHA